MSKTKKLVAPFTITIKYRYDSGDMTASWQIHPTPENIKDLDEARDLIAKAREEVGDDASLSVKVLDAKGEIAPLF